MSMKSTKLRFDVTEAPTSTRNEIFRTLFDITPSDKLAKLLVKYFANHEIETFINALQVELEKDKAK